MAEKIRTEIADHHNEGSLAHEIAEVDALIWFRAKYIIGVPGETVGDAEEPFDPPRGAASQTCEVDVKMGNPGLLESRSEIGGFTKASFVSEVARA